MPHGDIMDTMIIRKTEEKDVEQVLALFDDARSVMHASGIPQWTGVYPGRADVLKDIADGSSYVLVTDEGDTAATVCIRFEKDPNYAVIEGAWPDDEPYAVIHRIAVGSRWKRQGLAAKLISYASSLAVERHVDELRIDTHEKNLPMRGLVGSQGFVFCGTVHMLSDGTPRMAFSRKL